MSPVISARLMCMLHQAQTFRLHLLPQIICKIHRNRFASQVNSSRTRKWVCSTGEPGVTSATATPFTVMSYNILSQTHLQTHRSLYADHDATALNWPHRLSRISNEITQIAPDILCLQEVEQDNLSEIGDRLSALNFNEALYKKRSGNQIDGCAIFFNPNKFKLIESHSVDYFQPGVHILNRCNVAIVARFALQSNPSIQFVVATTHLLFNPKRTDVRLAQIQVLLAELHRIAHNGQHPIPIILSGDFNLKPDSEPFRLITGKSVHIANLLMQRKIFHGGNSPRSASQLLPNELGISDNCQHYDVIVHKQRHRTALHSTARKQKITDEQIQRSGLPFNTGVLNHKLNFETTMPAADLMRCASSCHHEWITVDYIFYTKYQNRAKENLTNLKLLANYQLTTIEECMAEGPIPNRIHGSDHYPLAARFSIE